MCISQNLSSLVVYYNKKLFEQAGVAYPSGRLDLGCVFTGGQGAHQGHQRRWHHPISMAWAPKLRSSVPRPCIWQNGGELVDQPAAPTKLALETTRLLSRRFQWFVDLQVRHKVAPDRIQEQAGGE